MENTTEQFTPELASGNVELNYAIEKISFSRGYLSTKCCASGTC